MQLLKREAKIIYIHLHCPAKLHVRSYMYSSHSISEHFADSLHLLSIATQLNKYRTDALVPSVMLSIRRDSLMFPSSLTLPSTPRRTMAPSVMLLTATPDLVIRRRTSRTLPMDGRLSLRLLWMPPRVPICSWSSPVCPTWMLSAA